MTQPTRDVIGVGNAIVDVLAKADDAFLSANDIRKGGMVLIDDARASFLYEKMESRVEASGGSAANTIACIASLGGNPGFVGKVGKDTLGDTFAAELRDLGVAFETLPLENGPGTGRCLVIVTPDAQRSMSTSLGAATYVTADDVFEEFIQSAAIIYFEGYLFEQESPRDAFVKACALAHEAGRRTALTLSDDGVVERQFDALHKFIGSHVDILFANENEAFALFETKDLSSITAKAKEKLPLTIVTRSEKGSIIIPRDGEPINIDVVLPTNLTDTTGAGDAYAAGVLFGLARDFDLARAGKLGSLCASEVISHFGARPEQQLETLARGAKLL